MNMGLINRLKSLLGRHVILHLTTGHSREGRLEYVSSEGYAIKLLLDGVETVIDGQYIVYFVDKGGSL